MLPQQLEVEVAAAPQVTALPTQTVREAVMEVLIGEDVRVANVSVTFLSGQRMRALNRRALGRDRATDVIAFGLPHPGRVVGDVYICPSLAQRSARQMGISEREEVLRLVVHGTLHVLGYEHSEGVERTVSTMWRLQERYLRRLMGESPHG